MKYCKEHGSSDISTDGDQCYRAFQAQQAGPEFELGQCVVTDWVEVTPDLYRVINRDNEADPNPWVDGSEQCIAERHLYVPLLPEEADTRS